MRRKAINISERYGVTAYFPPERITEIAQERTEGMVGAFLTTRTGDWRHFQEAVETLARSCYMQGLTDMTDTVIRRFNLIEK